MTIGSGNFQENEVLKNLGVRVRGKVPGSLLARRKKRDEESCIETGNGSSARGKKRKKPEINIPTTDISNSISIPLNGVSPITASNLIQFEVINGNNNGVTPKETQSNNLNLVNTANTVNMANTAPVKTTNTPPQKDLFSVDDSLSIANSKPSEGTLASFLSKGRKGDNFMLINTMSNFNDEAFESIIKEFLNINDFPSDPKDKVSILKRFIPLYKKIKSDKTKLTNFIKKIADKLNESVEEIKVK